MAKKLVAMVLGLAALVLNPFVACSLGRGFNFGAAEMRAAVEGTWSITAPGGPDHAPIDYTIIVAQGGERERRTSAQDALVAPATACASRSFVAAAAACVDSTAMPLDVQIVKGPSSAPAHGTLKVHGSSFDVAQLDLTVDGHAFIARLSPEGVATEAQLTDGGRVRTIELVRLADGLPHP